MHLRENLLFSEGDLHDTLNNHTRKINEKVNVIPKDQFLSTPEQDIIDHIFAEVHIEPLRRCIPFYETRPLTRMPSESNRVSLNIKSGRLSYSGGSTQGRPAEMGRYTRPLCLDRCRSGIDIVCCKIL